MKKDNHSFRPHLFVASLVFAVLAALLQTSFHPANATASAPQDPHVEVRYVKSSNLTVVTSDSLYVINMPTQFMQLQFTGRYPNQGPPTQMPDKVTLLFSSYATDPLYQKDNSHRLVVKADAGVVDFGLMSYAALRENGQDTYTAAQNSRLGLRSPIPPDALVRTTNQGKPLTLESMSATDVPLNQISKLAGASQVLMKIGNTVFQLTPTQLSILREFVTSITPTGGAATEATPKASTPNIPPEVPSNANNAPLDVTLKWLKNELQRRGAKEGIGAHGRIETADFKSCEIKYRIVPLFRTSPVSSNLVYAIIEYQFNLADINPESVRTGDLQGYSTITFDTVDHTEKIKVVTRANEGGMTGRTLDETVKSGSMLYLRDANSAAQIKAALVHAIGLCRTHK